jgi:hypothetical protein
VTPDKAARGPTSCIGMNWPMTHSMANMIDHNMVGSIMIDTNAGFILMNFLNIMLFLDKYKYYFSINRRFLRKLRG